MGSYTEIVCSSSGRALFSFLFLVEFQIFLIPGMDFPNLPPRAPGEKKLLFIRVWAKK